MWLTAKVLQSPVFAADSSVSATGWRQIIVIEFEKRHTTQQMQLTFGTFAMPTCYGLLADLIRRRYIIYGEIGVKDLLRGSC